MSLPTPPNTSHRDKENRLPPGCRISWSQQNQYHYLSTSPSQNQAPRPSGSRSPPPKSILKRTSNVLLPFEDENESCQREMTPEPADPMINLDYLASPVATILAPGDLPLRQVIEAYSVLTARLKSGVPATTDASDADASWPLFQPLRRNAQAIVDAFVRDLGKALVDPGASSEECEDVRVLLPSPKRSPKKKVGMTAEQVKYARDLCTTSHAVMKLLAVVFTTPAIYGVFTGAQLHSILTQILAIPLADELPTPNARKTCALSIWLIQSQRLPAKVLEPASDRIAYALQRGIDGELGKEGKKGSANDGLKAIHDLSTYQPATFLPAFTSLLPSILANLLASTLVLRTQACHALGGLVLALTALPACSLTSELHARISSCVAEFLMPSSTPKSSKSPSYPASPVKDPLIIRTLRTTLQATEPQAPAQGPAWALAVLGNLIVLLGPTLYMDLKLSRAISSLLALPMRHKKSSVRGLGCLVWRCISWVWLQPPFKDDSVDDETLVQEKLSASRDTFWRIVKSVVDVGAGVSTIVALLNDNSSPSSSDVDGNLRRVMQVMRGLIQKGGQNCEEAMDILKIFVSGDVRTTGYADEWYANKMLPSGLFNALPGILSADYKVLVTAVKPLFDECPHTEGIRALSREDLAKEWVFDELMDMWRKGLYQLELPDEYGTPTEVVAVWEGLIKASVSTLQDAGDGPGLTQFAVTVTEVLIDVLQDSTLDLTVKSGPPRKQLLSSSPMAIPPSTLSSGSLKLSIVRDLWASVRTHIPLDHLPLAGQKLIACLVDTEEDLVGEIDGPLHEDEARKHWAMLCAEVLYLCDRDELRSFWGARRSQGRQRTPPTWSKKSDVRCLVWAAFLHKWQDEAQWDWEGALALLCVPFVDAHGWEVTQDDFTAWDGFLGYAMTKALDYGAEPSAVLDHVARLISQNPSPAFDDSARIADTLLMHLEIADAREVPVDLFEFVNDVLTSTYPPAPRNKVTSSWLLRSLTRIIDACPRELALQILEIVRDGVALWVTDSFKVFDRQEYDDEIVPLYQTAVLSLQSLPNDMATLDAAAPILESAFCRSGYTPPAMLEAFDIFWTCCYAFVDVPASGWPWKIQACLDAVKAGSAEESVIDPLLLAEDAAALEAEHFVKEIEVVETSEGDNDHDEPLSFPESEDEDEDEVSKAAPSPAAEEAPTPTAVFDFSNPPTTPSKLSFQFSLNASTPPRPHKQPVAPTAFLPFLQSPGTPSHRTTPATPKRTPATLSIYSASESPSKRRKLDSGDKENASPRPVIATFTERLAMRSPGAAVLGKRRAVEETQEGSPLKKGRILDASPSPSDDSGDERLVAESLTRSPLDDPFVALPSTTKKRKRMVMEAVEVPSFQAVLLRDKQAATTPESKRTFRRTRSMNVRVGPSFVQALVYRSQKKTVNRTQSEDPFALSDPFGDSDDSMAWSSDKLALQASSSDDDPHVGQVTPHHLISPALRRTACDPPSDDSVQSSPSRHLAARRKQRLSIS